MTSAKRYEALPPSLAPRGLGREQAAGYIGVSAVKFDELVKSGAMPPPKRIGTRKVWDRIAVDAAFDALPGGDDNNEWDAIDGPN